MRRSTGLALAGVATLSLFTFAGDAQAQSRGDSGTNGSTAGRRARPRGASEQQLPGTAGRWSRIQLQHIDVRTVAALLGAPVMPTEADLYGGGFGGFAQFGSGFNQFGGGGYGGAPLGGMGGFNQFGSQGFAGQGFGGQGFAGQGFGGLGGLGGGGGLFPDLVILGDPRTNSLLVDP